MQLPILYSYRRCPYAMRARMALSYAGVEVEIREIDFKHKPEHMRQISPKATVPVLLLENGDVLEESLDIMRWALLQNDPQDWKIAGDTERQSLMLTLINSNDSQFKQALDHYKYAVRFPDFPPEHYRRLGETFLAELEACLSQSRYLVRESCSMADIAVFPFVRQFAAVDAAWWLTINHYPQLKAWLARLVESDLFADIMKKNPVWLQPN